MRRGVGDGLVVCFAVGDASVVVDTLAVAIAVEERDTATGAEYLCISAGGTCWRRCECCGCRTEVADGPVLMRCRSAHDKLSACDA